MSVQGRSVFAISLVIASLAATPAQTRQRTVVVTGATSDIVARQINYRDLDLASVNGEKKLVRRVHAAVANVCLDAVGGERGYMQQTTTCRRGSWEGAEPQIGRAVQRARDLAANGWSAIAPVAIHISVR